MDEKTLGMPVLIDQENAARVERFGSQAPKSAAVRGPGDKLYTRKDLLQPVSVRWTPNRKAAILAGIRGGIITSEEIAERYGFSADELKQWETLVRSNGISGLRVTRMPSVPEIDINDIPPLPESMEWHGVVLETHAKRLKWNGGSLHITPYEVRLLAFLLVTPQISRSKYEIMAHLYGGKKEAHYKIIDVFVCKLRSAMRVAKCPLRIETVWGSGFKIGTIN